MSQIPIFRETCPAADESSGIFRQFSHPTGWLGWWIGQIVAVTNRTQSEWVLESISVQPDDYILEMGFGAGTDITLVSALAIHGFVAGIDRSAVMVRQAKQRNAAAIEAKQVELHCGCALSIPYPDAMFDKIFSINVVQFWTNPLAELAELKRVLKSGGSIALAIQPRIPNASEATSQATGKFLLKLLNEAGFDRIELKSKLMKPVSIVCVLGIKKSA
jgi:ubiquinone/menaquinone biosynthesis C-methylase UbiE